MKRYVAFALLLAAPAWAAEAVGPKPETARLAPLTGRPPAPADNPTTLEKVRLGKQLFFESALSRGGRRSCSTCHKPELYFTDGFSRGWGLNESQLRRKTPNLLNVGWQRSMFFDSRAKTLEEQVSKPLENPHEMDADPAEAAARIASSRHYQRMFEAAFPGEPITFELISKAIASFERTLVSYDSDLDRYLLGDEEALGDEAMRGLALFSGKAGCIRCHNGPLLSDHQRHYTGVPEELGDNPPGTKYKTQSLRDVMRRYSYMHNGSLLSIADVLDHYQRGGSAPAGLEAEIEPFELSAAERSDLVAFLHSLNGRVNELLAETPESSDVFNTRTRAPLTAAEEEAAADPSYLKTPTAEEPVLDPNYKRPSGARQR